MKHYPPVERTGSLEKRYGIYSLLIHRILRKTGHTQTKIAEVLGINKSTISREVRRNTGKRNMILI